MTAGRLLGVSEAWQAVDRQIAELSLTCEVALIHGASGVGSETIAREIHRRSGLAGEFVVVSAACFPPGLLETEILGQGGALARATGGTLLVKCIEDSVEAQRVTAAAIRTSGTTACSYGWPGNVRELYCRVMAAHARRRGRLIDRLVFGPPC